MVIPADSMIGRYRIVAPAGQSGMTQTYRAATTAQDGSPAEVTLKVIDPALSNQPGFAQRFASEAAELTALRHPNILPVIDYGEAEGRAFLVYPALTGGTLRQQLGQPLAPEQALALLSPVAAALDAAHQRGVVHGNLKPRNILLAPNGAPVLDDFGLARLLEPEGPGTGQAALGTPAYMAPEQVQGQPVDGRTDQYALGIIAYQLLTGSVPFSGADPETVAWMHVREPLPPPSSRNPALAGPIEQVLLAALSREPSGRFPSCGAFISALGQAARMRPAVDAPATPPPIDKTLIGMPGQSIHPTEFTTIRAEAASPELATPLPAAAAASPQPAPPATPPHAPPAAASAPARPVQPRPAALPPATAAPPLLALAGAAGFVLAIIATLLPWVTVPKEEGSHYVNGWYPNVPYQIDDWLKNRHTGRTDAVVLLVLSLAGLALAVALLVNRRGAVLAYIAAALGALVLLLGFAELHYIGLRTIGGEGTGFGVWILIVAGLTALAGMIAEAVRRAQHR